MQAHTDLESFRPLTQKPPQTQVTVRNSPRRERDAVHSVRHHPAPALPCIASLNGSKEQNEAMLCLVPRLRLPINSRKRSCGVNGDCCFIVEQLYFDQPVDLFFGFFEHVLFGRFFAFKLITRAPAMGRIEALCDPDSGYLPGLSNSLCRVLRSQRLG
jgi:hypothetical protein